MFEYLDTTHQDMNPPYVDDAYYNHGLYNMGWSYKNYTLGNPFINHIDVEPTEVFHIGISGKFFSDYQYRINTDWVSLVNPASMTDEDGNAHVVFAAWEEFIGETVKVYCGYMDDHGHHFLDSLKIEVVDNE